MWGEWHSEQNRRLRSVGESVAWVQEQIGGGVDHACCSTVDCLQGSDSLRWVGLRCDFPASATAELSQDHGGPVEDDEIASSLGSLALHLVFMRLKRNMNMLTGWPSRSTAMLPGQPQGCGQLDPALLKTDYDTFVSMKTLRQAKANKLCERSKLHLLPVQRVVMAFEQSGWELDEAVTQCILSRSRRLLGAQIVEDGFKRQSRKQGLQANRRMRLSNVYKVLFERKVLGAR